MKNRSKNVSPRVEISYEVDNSPKADVSRTMTEVSADYLDAQIQAVRAAVNMPDTQNEQNE
jgi:hypothetical protein